MKAKKKRKKMLTHGRKKSYERKKNGSRISNEGRKGK